MVKLNTIVGNRMERMEINRRQIEWKVKDWCMQILMHSESALEPEAAVFFTTWPNDAVAMVVVTIDYSSIDVSKWQIVWSKAMTVSVMCKKERENGKTTNKQWKKEVLMVNGLNDCALLCNKQVTINITTNPEASY